MAMPSDWTPREDRRQAGGCVIRMAETDRGVCVRYLLFVRRAPTVVVSPAAVILRAYEDGTLTCAWATWED